MISLRKLAAGSLAAVLAFSMAACGSGTTTIAAGDYGWASHLEDGLWSYSQEEIWTGLQTAYAALAEDT